MTDNEKVVLQKMSRRWTGYMKILCKIDTLTAMQFDDAMNALLKSGIIERKEAKGSATFSDAELYRIK